MRKKFKERRKVGKKKKIKKAERGNKGECIGKEVEGGKAGKRKKYIWGER